MKRIAIFLLVLFVGLTVFGLSACKDNQPDGQGSGGDIVDPEGSGDDVTLPEELTILFQGDSITDSTRSRADLNDLGNGYARMTSESLAETYSGKIDMTFINRAQSGWKLIQNWNGTSNYEREFYQYDADIATILIGYNDIMAHKWSASNPYVSDEEFEEAYDRLLSGLKEHNTYAICIAPYYIYDYADAAYSEKEFTNKRAIVRSLASKYEFGYIDMKPYMTDAQNAGAELGELFYDGTHPIHAANKIISSLVVDAIRSYIDSDYAGDDNLGKYERIVGGNDDNAEDMINNRVYVYSALGDVTYDNTTFLNGDFTSSQSLKLTNRGIEQSGAYTSVSFVFDNNKKRDMTVGNLEFDVKLENAVKWLSLKAHSTFWTQADSRTSEYGIDFSNAAVCTDLGNGWYHIKVNLENWVNQSSENTTILRSVKQLVITMSRGETASQRSVHGVDLARQSAVWIDNLHITDGSTEPGLRGEAFVAGQDYIGYPPKTNIQGTKVVLDIKFTSGPETEFNVRIGQEWEKLWGYYTIYGDGHLDKDYAGVTVQELDDGYFRYVFDLGKLDKRFTGYDVPDEYVNLIYAYGPWNDAEGFIDFDIVTA
ncbi:MAG: SGNH/GDSL hydrolase family protein [Clostridia bacterium]|nr:SGNH/GDSL hydrolase family protein [Clostridia bacterium]